MMRLNLGLFVLLIAVCAGVVDSQYAARKLTSEYEQLKAEAKRNKTKRALLQLEQSTYAMHSRVEDLSTSKLGMEVPGTERIKVINLNELN